MLLKMLIQLKYRNSANTCRRYFYGKTRYSQLEITGNKIVYSVF